MLRDRQETFRKTLKYILVSILVIAFAVLIVFWTKKIQESQQQQELEKAMALIIKTKGRDGILEMAGIIDSYGEDPANAMLPVLSSDDPYAFTTDERQNIEIYEKYNKAVVNITTTTLHYNFFLEAVPQSGTGSGSIIDQKGNILTNYHVVEGADQVFVSLYDGTNYTGTVVGKDKENDLAIVKIEPEFDRKLTTIDFGSSSNLRVGQKVVAIGNPFGYDRTLTTGIVSGLGRPVKTDKNLLIMDMIQTDASINPGNSGGPLLDSRGKMIGINTTIYSTSGGSMGIGFAVPVDTAKRVIQELLEYGKVVRGWIDVTPVQLDSRIVEYAGLTNTEGLLVSKVQEGGKAAAAGIKGGTTKVKYGSAIIYLGGDVIVEVRGVKISDYADLFSALESTKPGDEVNVVVLRNGERKTMTVVLTERPAEYQWN